MSAIADPARRQAQLLGFIAGYAEAHDGMSPTLVEMAAAVGLHSKGAVHKVLRTAEAAGVLRRLPHLERAVEVLVPVAVPHAPDGAPLYFRQP